MAGNPQNVQDDKPQARAAGDTASTPLEDKLRHKARTADSAGSRLKEIAAAIDPRDEADHGGMPESDDPLNVMERTVRAIVGHLETSDRRNADALRHMQSQIQALARSGGDAALGEIEKRLDSLAQRIEKAGDATRPDTANIAQRVAGVTASLSRDGGADAPGNGYMSDFMRRQQRRRELMSDTPGQAAQPMPDIAGMIDEKTAELEKRMLQRFTELSQSLRAAHSKDARPAKEIGDLQSLVKELHERVNKLANKPAPPVYDDSEMRKAVNALHERLAAAEERFQGVESLERTMGKLMTRLDTAEALIREQSASATPGGLSEERISSLFQQLDDSRESMLAAAREAAAETADRKANEAARKTTEAALREAQNAAVEAAREAARAYLEDAGAGTAPSADDTRILASMQANLEQLRTEIGSTDYRSRAAIESVNETIASLTARLGETEQKMRSRPASAAADRAQPRDTIASAAGNSETARHEPASPAGQKPDLPPELAGVRLPVLDIPPLEARSAFVRDEIARRERDGDPAGKSAGTDRPREPGAGPPASDDRETGTVEAEIVSQPDAAAISRAAAGHIEPEIDGFGDGDGHDGDDAPDGRREPELGEPPASLRSARTTNELLAAARRAADAAGSQPRRADHKSLRQRLRIPRAGRKAAPAKPATPAAGTSATTGGKKPAGAKPAVRKPVILAVAAVILLAGSIEVYKIVREHGARLPDFLGGTPAKTQTSKPVDGGGQGTTPPAADAGKQIDGMAPAPLPPHEITGSVTEPDQPPSAAAMARSEQPAETRLMAEAITATGSAASADGKAAMTDTGAGAEQPETAAAGAEQPPTQAVAAEQPETAAAGAEPEFPEGLEPASLREAARAGDPVAQFEVASRLMEGRGVDADSAAARLWFQRAAASGLAPAQYRLGSLYEKGAGVETDLQQARLWYQRAAEQGNRKAMHNLAVLHADGIDGKPDFEAAGRWFRAAADLGLSDSQYNLGILHVRGLGVPQNFAEAHKWFSIVAAKGDKDAAARRDAIAERLAPDELAAARLAAQTWQAQQLVADANAVRLPDDGWKFAEAEPASKAAPMTAEADTTGTTAAPAPEPQGNEIVRRAQELLASLGYDPGPADGLMGPKTRDAVTIFQLRTGQPPTGEITPDLVKTLLQQAG